MARSTNKYEVTGAGSLNRTGLDLETAINMLGIVWVNDEDTKVAIIERRLPYRARVVGYPSTYTGFVKHMAGATPAERDTFNALRVKTLVM